MTGPNQNMEASRAPPGFKSDETSPHAAGTRDSLADVVSRAHYAGRITYVTRCGQRLAAIVPADLAEAIERAEDAADVAAAREALARIDDGDTPIPLTDLRGELGLATRS